MKKDGSGLDGVRAKKEAGEKGRRYKDWDLRKRKGLAIRKRKKMEAITS